MLMVQVDHVKLIDTVVSMKDHHYTNGQQLLHLWRYNLSSSNCCYAAKEPINVGPLSVQTASLYSKWKVSGT